MFPAPALPLPAIPTCPPRIFSRQLGSWVLIVPLRERGKPLPLSPPQLDKKQPKRDLTCPRPLVKPSGSHFLPLLLLLHPKETEAESRSYSPGQTRRLAWAIGSHASHWDVFRHSDTWVHPKCPLPLHTCRQVSWDTRRGNLCQGHRALAHAEPGFRQVPAHTPCALPAQEPAHSAAPRLPALPWATFTPCSSPG